ncbi:CGNR zinc finger domain-containing protein [Microbacterium sp. zg.B48]|nr:CGNR zinc finger domain-containing protein [Microbacterium sp. zg.B48]
MRAFVNTLDIETGSDALRDSSHWAAWADAHGIRGAASPDDLDSARRLREALRAGLLANHDRSPLPSRMIDALHSAADQCDVRVGFDGDGVRFRTAGSGMDLAFARIVAAVAASVSDGTWPRLKSCVNDACQWAFYDHSRSRTGRWCSMSICGNRAKQKRWRAGQGDPERLPA